ncbi:MAG TPA: aspartate aminotransferase family protein [Leptospiraceae bacterium]|nr:aspartate aminotransferase family protein [Leptospiraceae bacterium]HRG77371.1 aspartate aminotransferase family protein [Leptospiraceae bacterium]
MSDLAITKDKLSEVKERSAKYLIGNYAPYDVVFKYGAGELLFDTNNKQYIDCLCGVAVTNLGHSDADIIDVVHKQADMLFHTSNWFYSEEASLLAESLIAHSFPGKVFFCNSGTEANEAAFKLARKYAVSRDKHNPVMLSLKQSFHGRTIASMGMTGQEKIREGYGDLLPGFEYVEVNNEESLEEAFERNNGNISGLILELVIGEGGIIPLTQSFVNLARKLTQENDALLIFDEIQTGMGRTGKLFACEHYGIIPDAMTLGKALGSGIPIGALIVSTPFAGVLGPGSHGSTFGGNHMATAVAYETLRILISREIVENVPALSEFAFTRLRLLKTKYPIIKDVRGLGLHIGVDFTIPSKSIAVECLKEGLIVNSTADTVIRIMPPLNIGIERLDEALQIFERVIAKHI